MSGICIEQDSSGYLLLTTPYHVGLVAELKSAIPFASRRWDNGSKAWRIDAAYGGTIQTLVYKHLGEQIALPVAKPTTIDLTLRQLEVRYLGKCKERAGGERSAYGYCDGAWSVLFPERVLRLWFNNEARPGEERNLYEVLGTKRTASETEIKRAYRLAAMQWYPDRCHEPDAGEQFRAIQGAYEVLSSVRAKYDAGLALAGTLRRQAVDTVFTKLMDGYRAPLRCGLLLVEGRPGLNVFAVATILAWENIIGPDGRVLVTSWPSGAETFVEAWI